ncbi:MAG: hypothetical protein V4609_08750, partial [Pseudomonadota bacterium]
LVLLTVDDSGSMRSQFLPDGMVRLGSYSVAMPNIFSGEFSNYPRFQPDDFLADDPLIAGAAGSDNWLQAFMRSPDTNWQYYNPEVRYRPWVNVDGTRYPAAVPSRAARDPGGVPAGTVDLTLVSTALQKRWC